MPAYSLPYGTLHLDIDHADLPPDDLFALGARDNPRRAFLFVSQVLGKHIPVPTATLARVHRLLAAKLPVDLPAPVLFIGMAETATALAQGVFEAWLATHPATPALYLHTSRLRVKGADICPFEESHSHAAQQWLHLPAERGLLNAAQSLVLIDDELSTGNTFRALASALRPQLPALRTTHWLSLTDFSPPAAARDVQRHSLLRGRWHYEAIAAVPPVAAVQEAPITIADSGFGRLGIRQAVRLDSAVWVETGDIGARARPRPRHRRIYPSTCRLRPRTRSAQWCGRVSAIKQPLARTPMGRAAAQAQLRRPLRRRRALLPLQSRHARRLRPHFYLLRTPR